MTKPTRTINQAQQNFSFSRRAMMLGGAQAAMGVVLAGRMAWLSIAESKHYQLLSESKRINNTVIPPRRGWLVDRNGHPLADNRPDYRVHIIPDRLENKERTLALLQALLALTPDAIDRLQADL